MNESEWQGQIGSYPAGYYQDGASQPQNYTYYGQNEGTEQREGAWPSDINAVQGQSQDMRVFPFYRPFFYPYPFYQPYYYPYGGGFYGGGYGYPYYRPYWHHGWY